MAGALGIVIFIAVFLLGGAVFVVRQSIYVRNYAARRPGVVRTDQELREQFFSDPLKAYSTAMRDTPRRFDVLLTPVDDAALETQRRRTVWLFACLAGWMILGLPVSFFVVGTVSRLRVGNVAVLAGVAIVAAWLVTLAVAAGRRRLSPVLLLVCLSGVGVGLLVSVAAMSAR